MLDSSVRTSALLLLLVASGCIETTTVACADGRLCPIDTVCDELHQLCVTPEQLTTCVGVADRVSCDIGGNSVGLCRDEVCLREGCGDRFITGSERCDGEDLGLADDCQDLGYHQPGPIVCAPDCTYDVSECDQICGDGNQDPAEACDGTQQVDCQTFGYYDSVLLTCNDQCRYDTTPCTGYCGDDDPNGEEVCDGAPPEGQSCLSYGLDRGFLECSLCGPDFAACDRIGWEQLAVPSLSIYGIHGTSDDDVFAVGGSSCEIRHHDGQSWSSMDGPASCTIYLEDVFAIAPDDVYAVGQGTIIHYDGASWSDAEAGVVAFSGKHIWASGPGDVYLAGNGLRHGDLTGWSSVTISGSSSTKNDVWGRSADDVYVTDSSGALWHYTGGQWVGHALPTGFLARTVWGTATLLFVAGRTSAGETAIARYSGVWSQPDVLVGFTGTINDLWGSSSTDVYATGDGGTVFHHDGVTWSPLLATTSPEIGGVWGSRADNVFVGTLEPAGRVFRHHGSSWLPLEGPVTAYPHSDVWATSKSDVYVLEQVDVDNRRLRHWDGAAWETFPLLLFRFLEIWGDGVQYIHVVGQVANIRRFDIVTSTWTTTALNGSFFDVNGSSASNVWAVGGVSGADVARNQGAGWVLVASTGLPTLRGVWTSGATNTIVVGSGGAILRYDTAWSAMVSPTTRTLRAVWGTSPSDVFAVGDGGTIVHYDGNASNLWTAMDSPTIYDLKGVWGAAADDVFAVGVGGTLLHYDGTRWTPVRGTTGLDLLAVWGNGPDETIVLAQDRVDVLYRTVAW